MWGYSQSNHGTYGESTGVDKGGVYGVSFSGGGVGVWGVSALGTGVRGTSSSGNGVERNKRPSGVYGESTDYYAVYGYKSAPNSIPAVMGKSEGSGGVGVAGWAHLGSSAVGVAGESMNGTGVLGVSSDGYGVQGHSQGLDGVYGGSTSGYGVHGYSDNGDGMFGESSAAGKSGVYAVNTNPAGYAGDFNGRVQVNGDLNVNGTKNFYIEHPLEPGRVLVHAAVESSEVLNVYSGNVRLDGDGRPWWSCRRGSTRSTPTSATSSPRSAPPRPGCYVAEEVAGNRFGIAGGQPRGLKVSWLVDRGPQRRVHAEHPFEAERDAAPGDLVSGCGHVGTDVERWLESLGSAPGACGRTCAPAHAFPGAGPGEPR